MDSNIINLKKGPTHSLTGEQFGLPYSDTSNIPTLEWSAPEYVQYKYKRGWFILVGIMAFLIFLWGILAGNYFFLTLITLAFALLFIYTRRVPRVLFFAINPHGVQVEKTIYVFSNIHSFCIFERAIANELSLELKAHLSSYINIPLGDTDPKEVSQFLSRFIPEKEHKEFFIDQLGRSLGF